MAERSVRPEHYRNKKADVILKENQDLYDELFFHLAEMGGFTVGKTPSAMKVLVHYFPPQIAEVVLRLGAEPKTAAMVAKETGKPVEHIQEILDRYWLTGLVRVPKATARVEGYIAPRGLGSVFTAFPFCDGVGATFKLWDEDEEKEVGLLTSKIHFEEGHLQERGSHKQPMFMVLVDERQVLNPEGMQDWEKASQHILQQKRIGITRCGCRVRHGLYNKCKFVLENPMMDVCLQFGELIDPYVERGAGYLCSYEDALDVLWYGLDAGLVSTAMSDTNIPGQWGFICQCCPDCCHLIGPWTRLGMTGSGVHRSNFDPRTDLERCTCGECGGDAACIKACPVPGVRFYHPPTKRHKSDEFIGVDTRRCMGCGLCAGACPEKAIKMVKTRNWVPSTPEARAKAGRHEWIDKPPAL